MVRLISHQLNKRLGVDVSYYLSGGFWLFVAQIASIVSSLAVTVIFARTLSEHDFGVYRYIISIGILLSAFSLSGIDIAIFQTASRKIYGFFPYGVRMSLVYGVGIFIGGTTGFIYYFLNDNLTLAIGCLVVAVLQPIANSSQLIFPFLTGSKRFKESSTLLGVKALFVGGTSLVTISISENVLVLFGVFLLTQITVNTIVFMIYRPSSAPEVEVDEISKSKYFQYGRNTSIRNMISNIALRIDSFLIFQQLGSVELAIYSIALTIPEQIKGTFKNLNTLLLPKYVEHKDFNSTKINLTKRTIQLFLISVAVTFAYILVSPMLFALLFPTYPDAVFLSQLLSLSFPAMAAVAPMSALQAHIKERELYFFKIFESSVLLTLTLSFVFLFGLIGAIAAKIISRYLNLFLSLYFVYTSRET